MGEGWAAQTGGPAEGAAGRWGLGWCRQDNEWPSTPPRPREDVMEKRKLLCGGMSQRGRGLGRCGIRRSWCLDPSSHAEDRRDSGHTTIYPPDRLGPPPPALVTKTHACTLTCVPTHTSRYAWAPPPPSMDPDKGMGTSPPPHPTLRAFFWPPLSSPPHQVGAHRGHSTSWMRSCGLSSEPLGSILSLLTPSAPSAHHPAARRLARSG